MRRLVAQAKDGRRVGVIIRGLGKRSCRSGMSTARARVDDAVLWAWSCLGGASAPPDFGQRRLPTAWAFVRKKITAAFDSAYCCLPLARDSELVPVLCASASAASSSTPT